METCVHSSLCITQPFLEWEMFHTEVVLKIKHILYSLTFFPEVCRLWDNVEKFCRTRQATYDNTMRHRKDVNFMKGV
jgi:hypothetical protein